MRNPPFTKSKADDPIKPLFLTDDEAGRVAGVSGRTIRTWRQMGLKSIKIAGTRRTYMPDLVEFLTSHRVEEGAGRE